MKTLRVFMFIGVLGLLAMACSKDDPAPANPTINSGSTQLVDGIFKGVLEYQDLSIKISGTAPAGLVKLNITKTVDGVTTTLIELAKTDVVVKESAFEYVLAYKIVVADLLEEVTLKAEIIDAKGKTAQTQLAIVRGLRKLKKFALSQSGNYEGADKANVKCFLQINFSEGLTAGPSPNVYVQTLEGISAADYNLAQVVFDYNVGQLGGPYFFASPSVTSPLVQGFTVKNTTAFKIVDRANLSASDVAAIDNLSANDPHVLASLFDKLPASTNPQRVPLGAPSTSLILFKTSTGQVALMHNFTAIGYALLYDLWVSVRPQ